MMFITFPQHSSKAQGEGEKFFFMSDKEIILQFFIAENVNAAITAG